MQAALERAMQRLVLGPPIDPQDPTAVRTWLAEAGVAPEDVETIVSAGPERLLVYRNLARGSLWRALERGLAGTMARMGERFEAYFDRFLAERGPRSRDLRDLPGELLDFCEPLCRADPDLPAWLMDFARYELTHHEIATMRSDATGGDPKPLALDAPVRFGAPVRVLRQAFAVHAFEHEPEARPTILLIYRDADHRVRALELAPVSAAIVEHLLHGHSLRDALGQACAAHDTPLDGDTIAGATALLADLADRGILLGAGDDTV